MWGTKQIKIKRTNDHIFPISTKEYQTHTNLSELGRQVKKSFKIQWQETSPPTTHTNWLCCIYSSNVWWKYPPPPPPFQSQYDFQSTRPVVGEKRNRRFPPFCKYTTRASSKISTDRWMITPMFHSSFIGLHRKLGNGVMHVHTKYQRHVEK